MPEDRERLLTLRTILDQAGYDWDLTGDPPEIPESDWSGGEYAREAIEEIQRDFTETLAAIAAGTDEAPVPPENVGRFDDLSESLLQLGVSFDGSEDPPDLDQNDIMDPEQRELVEAILAEMVADYPDTIARRRKEGHMPLLLSLRHAEPFRDAPEKLPPLLKPRVPKNMARAIRSGYRAKTA